jgi:hypothetical protein
MEEPTRVIPPQENGEFVARMEQVLDVYKRPFDPLRPVVCMDESPRQLIRETRLPLPAGPGVLARFDYEYERCGVCNVFLAIEPLAGMRIVEITEHRSKKDWASFLDEIARHYVQAERITLVKDNPEHPRCGIALRDLSTRTGQGPVGPLRAHLHPQARLLAQHRRDRDQRAHPPVPEPTNRHDRRDSH